LELKINLASNTTAMDVTINPQTTFEGIDKAKLAPILQEYRIPQAQIDKILASPSLFKVADIITDPIGLSKIAEILPPSGKNTAPITSNNISAFEKLFQMIIDLQSDMSKLQNLLNKLGLSVNAQALEATKLGNEKIASAEKTNAWAQIASGVVGAASSGLTMKVSFNGGKLPTFFNKTGVNAQSSPRVLSEAGMQAMNASGQALGGIGTGIAGIVAANESKDGKNSVADADFQKTGAQALAEAVNNLRNQIDNQQAAAGVITSFIQSVARN
jgi:hypothetical protein